MKLTNHQFDVTGCEIGRTWRQGLVYGLIPRGRADRGGGPGWGLCVKLWLWHRFGGALCRLAMRFEKQAIGGYALLARLRNRISCSSLQLASMNL